MGLKCLKIDVFGLILVDVPPEKACVSLVRQEDSELLGRLHAAFEYADTQGPRETQK